MVDYLSLLFSNALVDLCFPRFLNLYIEFGSSFCTKEIKSPLTTFCGEGEEENLLRFLPPLYNLLSILIFGATNYYTGSTTWKSDRILVIL